MTTAESVSNTILSPEHVANFIRDLGALGPDIEKHLELSMAAAKVYEFCDPEKWSGVAIEMGPVEGEVNAAAIKIRLAPSDPSGAVVERVLQTQSFPRATDLVRALGEVARAHMTQALAYAAERVKVIQGDRMVLLGQTLEPFAHASPIGPTS